MPILVVGLEKNFAALRSRLFSGRVSTAAARRVADAIREANPHVDLDRLAPGTVLNVPDLPEISVDRELSLDELSERAVEALFRAATDVLEELAGAADALHREEASERKRLLKALEGREVRAAADQDGSLAADLDDVGVAVEEEEARAKQSSAALKRAREEWTAELEALRTVVP
ncbi:MAG: hypothetical protein ACRDHV_09230 [Actinomycetota bacterium]